MLQVDGGRDVSMDFLEEFRTVDLILRSSADTRAIDAFTLALMKSERQMRSLFTHLVYQHPCFGPGDISNLREVLGRNRRVYFEGFEQGIDALYPRTVKELIGGGYDRLRHRLKDASEIRRKIFHGQLTQAHLSREDLLGYVVDIRQPPAAGARPRDATSRDLTRQETCYSSG